MRIDWPTSAAFLVVAVGVVGCESSQPDSIDTRTASVSFTTRAQINLFDCYEVWVDQSDPPDGIPDFATVFCELAPADQVNRQVPWNYSLGISIIRAGTTSEVAATSLTGSLGSSIRPGDDTDAIADFVSLTDFDPVIATAPAKPDQDGFEFRNGKRVSQGSPVFLSASGFNVGTPNILGTPLAASQTFDFSVNTGDTIVVRARKLDRASAPPYLPPDTSPTIPGITLEATLAVGGISVNPDGNSASSGDDKSGFTLSFTVP